MSTLPNPTKQYGSEANIAAAVEDFLPISETIVMIRADKKILRMKRIILSIMAILAFQVVPAGPH